MFDRLKSALEQADKTAGRHEIDQIAHMLGGFPKYHTMRKAAAGCPRLCALLPKVEPAANEQFALFHTAECMNRDDVVGEVAGLMHGVLQA